MSGGDEETPKFTLVAPDDPAYALMDELVAANHPDLSEAKIALMWAHAFKPDRDGHVTWGQCKKVSPMEQQFHDHNFLILLNSTVWGELASQANAQKALLDHELCHAASTTNDEGEATYYTAKHDLEEFVEIVQRYGLWRASVEALVNAALEQRRRAGGPEAP